MPESRTYPAGVPSWVDVSVSDLDAARDFYGGLFGWTFEDARPPEGGLRYLVARLHGSDVAGVTGPVAGTASWHTYVAVDDADAAAARVLESEGRVLVPPVRAGRDSRFAVCSDPAGVEIRVREAVGHPGAQLVNSPGAWNFSDLHAADPPASTSFYVKVFGWEVDDLGFAGMIRRPGYGDHLVATVDPGLRDRQADIGAPPGFDDAVAWLVAVEPGEPPHWHLTFAVADRDEAVVAVRRLGGTVLRGTDTEWTREALVRDPHGAAFTVSQFTPGA
jgi:predicted enzyme related to lactoylglutathione lyase